MDFFAEPSELLCEKWFQQFGQNFASDGVKPAKQDFLVLDYLLQSYNNHLTGVILNVEQDFNLPLHILTFIRNTCDNRQFNSCLIVCSDEALVKWHYWASQDARFSVILVTEEIQKEFETSKFCIYLLNFSRLKLLESIVNYDFFTLVIDSIDIVATKLIIRKLCSNFNIGITYRNFYEKPDQKLQWTMLNWANPGCVGKWSNFPLLDNANFGLFRDSYRQWWLRLTWDFCNSFVKPSLEEKGKWNNVLNEWASLPIFKSILVTENTGRKVARKRKLTQRQRKRKSSPLVKPQKTDTSDSDDTVIYELANKTSDENVISQRHTDEHDTIPKSPVKTEVVHIEDESDVFLKYVATNNDFSKVFVKSKIFVQNNHSPSHEEVDSELMERRLFKTEEFTESDSFLKEICSQSPIKAEVVSERESNIYTLETSLEVDALVADVMKMVQQ